MGDKKRKILVGLSGGVDSTVCCRLLQAEHEVYGLYCIMSDAHQDGVRAAEAAAGELGIDLTVLDLRARFSAAVVDPFMVEYCRGRTPNPCIVCNPLVKFAALSEQADNMGIERIATGHYARVIERGCCFILQKSAETARDQSYMLYRLPQQTLARLSLPLGGLTKEQVREIARERGYSSAGAPDSQEICFIPDGDYPGYIHHRGLSGKAGNFVAPSGKVLGPHRGVEHYTVGQRRGLGLSLGQPAFVRRIAENGDILLGFSGEEYASNVSVRDAMLNPYFDLKNTENLTVKLRSMQAAVPCSVGNIAETTFSLSFSPPQRAPAPGQSAVLYADNLLVGGGIIDDFE